MAEVTEYTSLVEKLNKDQETGLYNLGYGSQRQSTSTSMVDVHNGTPATIDELLFRIQYAFLDKSYDVVADVSSFLQKAPDEMQAAEQLLNALNGTPLGMQDKIKISRLLRQEDANRGRPIHPDVVRRRVQRQRTVNEGFRMFHLWERTITSLTAYFGSNVASYFRFVRTLVYINAVMAVLLVSFITVPQLVTGSLQSDVKYGGHFGELSNSIMFYGAYSSETSLTYNMTLSYFLTWFAANLLCFVVIISIMVTRYRHSKLSEKGEQYQFAWKMFCTWDHSITTRPGVIDQRTALKTHIKEIVRDEKSTVRIGFLKLCLRYAGRLVSNLLVLSLLVGSGYLIYIVAEDENILPSGAPDSLRELFEKYQLTAVVAALKVIIPPVFEQLVRIEGWHPRVATKITLARTTLFYFASLIIFVVSLYDVTDNCYQLGNGTTTVSENGTACCWENEVGEEVFKLILFDLGLCIAIGLLLHCVRAAIHKCFIQIRIGYSEFSVVSCVLDVIYGQGLIWLGLYFSPLLAAVGLLKLIVVFYFRYFVAKVAMIPSKKVFRTSSTGNFYLAILLLNLFVSLFPMAYAVIELHPSPDCGPFRAYDHAYLVISSVVGDLPDWLENVLDYLTTPAIIAPILIFLMWGFCHSLMAIFIFHRMTIVYYKVKSASYAEVIIKLRKQLNFERLVEKRKVFATGRAMSAPGLSKYSSQESLTPSIMCKNAIAPSISPAINEIDGEGEYHASDF